MAAPPAPPKHFVFEDTVSLVANPMQTGIVDRSFGDVDSHEPRPQREYDHDIERHPDIPQDQFQKFMRSGIPPRGTVLVTWYATPSTTLIPEACVELLDRALYVGDVVKKSAQDPMSGTVIGSRQTCSIAPNVPYTTSAQALEEATIRDVPAAELLNVHEITEGALVVYGDWVGKIVETHDDVAIKLANNSVVVVENADELEPDDAPGPMMGLFMERFGVGDAVKTKKGNLRRGRWKYGSFSPNVRPHGVIVETRTVGASLQWLAQRMGILGDRREPPEVLELDELESSEFRIYDASGDCASTLPVSENGSDLLYHVADVTVADRVRFKDPEAAAAKYDGTRTLPSGMPQGKLVRVPRTETLGYDMNVFVVRKTSSQVTVQWQDLTISEHPSSLLIPDPNIEDDVEVWPGEIVCSNEERTDKSADVSWTFEPAKVGVVQGVQSRDRLATVRWFQNPSIRFHGEDLIPPSSTGNLGNITEEVSLYDIRSIPTLTRRRGDFVMIHPDQWLNTVMDRTESDSQGPDWFGEITDLGLDGKLTVRLGAARSVRDLRIPSERVTLVYSSDMDAHHLHPELDDEADDYSDDYEDEYGTDFESEAVNEMWIEYEGMDGQPGQPIGEHNDEDWSTEDEDEDTDDDVSMPDVDQADDVETPKTEPETHTNDTSVHLTNPMAIESLIAADSVSSAPLIPSTVAPALSENTMDLDTDSLAPFLILDTPPPSGHHYINTVHAGTASTFMKRIVKEHKILSSSLPPGILVRTWESRLDLIRVLMIGPSDTPYEYAPFIIDFHLDYTYPAQPPEAFFHSWTNGSGPVNPNLYEDGKICLSLLGTWHADERNESWSPNKSTLLQVLISIHSLVLVKEPYYNEAGYDIHRQAPETKLSSALYSERTYFKARAFIVHALTNPVEPFADELNYMYLSRQDGAPQLLVKAITAAKDILQRSEADDAEEKDGLRHISRGAAVPLKRQVDKLEELTARIA